LINIFQLKNKPEDYKSIEIAMRCCSIVSFRRSRLADAVCDWTNPRRFFNSDLSSFAFPMANAFYASFLSNLFFVRKSQYLWYKFLRHWRPTTKSIHIWHWARKSIPSHIGGSTRALPPLQHLCSHLREQPQLWVTRACKGGAKRSGGKEAPRNWVCLGLCNFFISASPDEVKYHWSKSRKAEKTVNLLIMFGEGRLDPHGVGSLPHVLTTKNKSSKFRVKGRVEFAYYWCLNNVQVCESHITQLGILMWYKARLPPSFWC